MIGPQNLDSRSLIRPGRHRQAHARSKKAAYADSTPPQLSRPNCESVADSGANGGKPPRAHSPDLRLPYKNPTHSAPDFQSSDAHQAAFWLPYAPPLQSTDQW